jgi:hypothetical protein
MTATMIVSHPVRISGVFEVPWTALDVILLLSRSLDLKKYWSLR